MDILNEIKKLVDLMTVEVHKIERKPNRSAGIRARKYALKVKNLIKPFRDEILNTMPKKGKNGTEN